MGNEGWELQRVGLWAQAGPVTSVEHPLSAPVTFYFTSTQIPALSLPRKKAQEPHQPLRPHQTHGAACTEVLLPFLLGSDPLKLPGHRVQIRNDLWSEESPLSPRRRRTGMSSTQLPPNPLQCCQLREFLHSVPLCSSSPPGISLSHGPSYEFLLLLLRPGLARKEPGQPKSLCG